jgi:hypothetical protein
VEAQSGAGRERGNAQHVRLIHACPPNRLDDCDLA